MTWELLVSLIFIQQRGQLYLFCSLTDLISNVIVTSITSKQLFSTLHTHETRRRTSMRRRARPPLERRRTQTRNTCPVPSGQQAFWRELRNKGCPCRCPLFCTVVDWKTEWRVTGTTKGSSYREGWCAPHAMRCETNAEMTVQKGPNVGKEDKCDVDLAYDLLLSASWRAREREAAQSRGAQGQDRKKQREVTRRCRGVILSAIKKVHDELNAQTNSHKGDVQGPLLAAASAKNLISLGAERCVEVTSVQSRQETRTSTVKVWHETFSWCNECPWWWRQPVRRQTGSSMSPRRVERQQSSSWGRQQRKKSWSLTCDRHNSRRTIRSILSRWKSEGTRRDKVYAREVHAG